MKELRSWSFARVLLVSVGWIVFSLLSVVAWVAFPLIRAMLSSSGSGGIGAVSVGVSELPLAIPIIPPIVLLLAWLISRSRRA